ncbi:MAG: M48 family metalloprotease [Fibromonadales bacterium]|nr:M48 family metalloprotease [Fibromonadales bacterium]
MSNRWKVFWVAALMFVAFFQACGMHSWEEMIVSTADERQMGREFDSLIRIGHKDVMEPGESILVPQTAEQTALYNYLQARAKDIVNKIDSKDLDALLPSGSICGSDNKQKCTKDNFFEFKIINSKTVNAFAVPGGYIYFYTAILKNFKSESELSSVLGHEIGHVVLHHSRNGIVKQVGASVIIDALLGDGMGATLASLGTSFWLLGNSRENESQSDSMAFTYTNKMGISSEGLGDFFSRGLKSYDSITGFCEDPSKDESFLDVLSTHPPSCERVNNNKKRIKNSGQTLATHPKDLNLVNGKKFTQLVIEAKL